MVDTTSTRSGSSFPGPVAPPDIGAELIAAVRDSATALFEEQRDRAAGEIAAFGELLRHSAQSLDQCDGGVARYADEAASRIGTFAEELQHRSWDELASDIADFAQHWPLAFLAAAVGAGFAAGRFLALSAPPPADQGGAPAFVPQERDSHDQPVEAAPGDAAAASGNAGSNVAIGENG